MNFLIRFFILCLLSFLQSCVVQKDLKQLMSLKCLIDVKNNQTSISQNTLKEKPFVIIIFATDCPISQKYVPILRGISDSLSGIKFIMVFSKWETLEAIKTFALDFNNITFLHDTENKLVKKLKATTTPEAFFYDKSQRLLYQGAIDNWFFALGRYRPQATELYLKNAITQYLKNEKITVSKTNPIGCLIEY